MTGGTDKACLVSVVMPTYNQAGFIGEAIESVLCQTHSRLELIVVDNNSADNTRAVVLSFDDPRIALKRFDNRGVIASSRNYATGLAKGELIAFLDSDDVWMPTMLAHQMEQINDRGIACVSTNFVPIGDVAYCRHHLTFGPGQVFRDYSYRDVALANPVMTSSAMVRRGSFREVSGFDEKNEFKFIEDYELWLRMARLGRIRVLAKPLLKYRISRKKPGRDTVDVQKRAMRIFEKHRDLGYMDRHLFHAAEGNSFVNVGRALLDNNDWNGVKYYGRGLFRSRGMRNKIRCISGLLMFALPQSARRQAMDTLYRVNTRFFPGYDKAC